MRALWLTLLLIPSHALTTQPRIVGKCTLPIFPLRKGVRLPTESIVLNLYEARYRALAKEAIKLNVFGVLDSGSKAQVVSLGSGPIVPLVEAGDVGVLCVAEESEDTSRRLETGEIRKSIRLQGRGALRFRIAKILSDGIETEDENKTPFIEAQVELLMDAPGSILSSHPTDSQYQGICQALANTVAVLGLVCSAKELQQELLSFASTTVQVPERFSANRRRLLTEFDVDARARLLDR